MATLPDEKRLKTSLIADAEQLNQGTVDACKGIKKIEFRLPYSESEQDKPQCIVQITFRGQAMWAFAKTQDFKIRPILQRYMQGFKITEIKMLLDAS